MSMVIDARIIPLMCATTSLPPVVGVDVGGTFTDFVAIVDGRLRVHKRSTTPDDQSRAVIDGLRALGIGGARMVHGTTVATNALLERRGARTALVTTGGFADVIEIGRQNRPLLYALSQSRPASPVPRELRFEIPERLDATGRVVLPLSEEAVRAAARSIAAADVESIAVVLLFSFLDAAHERRVAEILRLSLPDVYISLGSEILPEYREYERTATTVVNAYVGPVVARYLARLAGALGADGGGRLRIMQSNGGAVAPDRASSHAAGLLLSGPAGGVVGAFHAARRATATDVPRIVTLDMGGTSADVALCPGRLAWTSESLIDGLPLRLPAIDIHTVGAGGGSIAWVDPAGALRVGPGSAGAVPGPACYGRGGVEPTVSDANLVLGRLDPRGFLGGIGDITLDADAAYGALERLGSRLGLSAADAALGVVRVVNATMERALRRVSVERGHDPREFVLVPFGGSGPLHGCELAEALGIRRILVPPHPGALSAFGMLVADIVYDESRSIISSLDAILADPAILVDPLEDLVRRVAGAAAGQSAENEELRIDAGLDLRYVGQSHELTVPLRFPPEIDSICDARESFHDLHETRYGYALRDRSVEAVTLRVRGSFPGASAPVDATFFEAYAHEATSAADAVPFEIGSVRFDEAGELPTRRYDRATLRPGMVFDGPAIVRQLDTTTLIPPGWRAHVDNRGNMWIERIGSH